MLRLQLEVAAALAARSQRLRARCAELPASSRRLRSKCAEMSRERVGHQTHRAKLRRAARDRSLIQSYTACTNKMKLLPGDGGQLVEEPEYFGERTFLKAAMARFPQLASDPDLEVGIHLSMAALARLAMGAVRSGDIRQARAVVDFLEEVLATPRLHPEIRNAVAVSFLEPSELATFEAGGEFLESMPPSVRHLLG